MKIKSFQITNLQGRINCNLIFNEDVNIITGENGSGKTTIIKVLWYLISGNIERIFREVTFESLKLKTTSYDLSINISESEIKFVWKGKKDSEKGSYNYERKQKDLESEDFDIDFLNLITCKMSEGSVFFPTFRRIEGGFSLTENPVKGRLKHGVDTIERGLSELSGKLSVLNNYFIASISTNDIIDLLRRKHSQSSEEVNQLHIGMSEYIEKKIQTSQTKPSIVSQESVLNDIKKKVDSITIQREKLLSPFTTLALLISEIYKHKGIYLTDKFSVGNTEEAINSAKLSAGEKQLLSFICYNAFYRSCPFFIDEPELSLHVDWQRNLISILDSQKANNQLIIATHSPFIYSKYPDKELLLEQYRGI